MSTESPALPTSRRVFLKNTGTIAAATAFVLDGLARGALRPRIDRIFPFGAIADAHRHLEGNGQVGKIVVTV